MKNEYDFSNGKRGPVFPTSGKTRVSIHIDKDLLDWFRAQVPPTGGDYQAIINAVLRNHMISQSSMNEGDQ